MNNRTVINSGQLAILLVAMTTGSAIVYIPNPLTDIAGNSAWLSMLIAGLFGGLLTSCILYLYNANGRVSLIQYSRKLIGRLPTLLLTAPLIVLLFFAVPAITAGIGDFFTSIMMKETPAYVFNALSLATAALTARAGVQVTARMFVLLVIIMVSFSLIVILLAVPLYKLEYLLPLLPGGWKPVWHGAFLASGFPFGEMVFFSMLLPYATGKGTAPNKQVYWAIAVTTFVLLLSTFATLLAFGPASGFYKYSLYRLASEIQIADIIQRVESIIGIALILGSYMKDTLYLLILNQLIVQLLNLRNERALIYPITLACIWLSVSMFKNPAEFTVQVYEIWPFLVLLFGCCLIFLLTLVSLIKHRMAPEDDAAGRDAA